MSRIKHWLYWITGGMTVVFAVFYAGNVLTIGEKLGKLHVGLEVGFDTFMLVAPLLILLYGAARMLMYKSYDIGGALLEADDKLAVDRRRKLADILLSQEKTFIPEDMRRSLADPKAPVEQLRNTLRDYFDLKRKEARTKGVKMALFSSVSVMVSGSGSSDMALMLFWNIRLISEIVRIYGVRPGIPSLVKLYCYVLFGAFISGGIDEIMSDACGHPETFSGLPLPGVKLLAEGGFAAFYTLRTCSLTQHYLMHGFSEKSRRAGKMEALAFALNEIPSVMLEAVKNIAPVLKDSVAATVKKVATAATGTAMDMWTSAVRRMFGTKAAGRDLQADEL
jgi:hypothetical protein